MDAAVAVPVTPEQCFGADNILHPAVPLQHVHPADAGEEVLFLRSGRRLHPEQASQLAQENCRLEHSMGADTPAAVIAHGVRHAVVRANMNINGVTYMSRELADHLGLAYQVLGGNGMQPLVGDPQTIAALVDPIQIQLLNTDGGPLATFTAYLVFVTADAHVDLQVAADLCGTHSIGGGVWSIGLPDSGALVPLPRLLPRRWRAGEPRFLPFTTTFVVAQDTYAEAVALVAARAAVRARLAAAAAGQNADAAAADTVAAVVRFYMTGDLAHLPPILEILHQQGVAGAAFPVLGQGAADAAAGLPPLPPSLRPARWAEVAATHVPPHDTECVVCAWSLTGAAGAVAGVVGGGGEPGPGEHVVQLRCGHTYHELCVRQMLQRSHTASCPLCRAAIAG
ncbi:hypothetical protein HXX76_013674 [Chlamydomonas incerta]|uniref:RING-type domain-containing protein n=1 Tax=Chlamydomonas incerta TaxID=51695 RepID=A0A835SNL7_CHLIN|nr:hypothetical protein HXX76_013674 [Chlamydomonas incerta]|eukprot:KAG2425464.1 hypothetical protein HXX76_013674 [Chlamydomonas incerta]